MPAVTISTALGATPPVEKKPKRFQARRGGMMSYIEVTKSRQEIITSSRWTLMRNERGTKSILTVDTDITEKQLEAQFLTHSDWRTSAPSPVASPRPTDMYRTDSDGRCSQEKHSDQWSQQFAYKLEVNAKQ